mmetsp:Transcript_44805/g.106797  ORF Transcript_44805/g.106797 Transcript_44805/m.106797 type:complete len:215 (-) Transcript_44805:44-688(-)
MVPWITTIRSLLPGAWLSAGVMSILPPAFSRIALRPERTSTTDISGMRSSTVMSSPAFFLACSLSWYTSWRMAATAFPTLPEAPSRGICPEIATTRASVPGKESEECDTLTRAPDLDWMDLMVAPPRPMMVPASLLCTMILKYVFCMSTSCLAAGFWNGRQAPWNGRPGTPAAAASPPAGTPEGWDMSSKPRLRPSGALPPDCGLGKPPPPNPC